MAKRNHVFQLQVNAANKIAEFKRNNPELKDIFAYVDDILLPLVKRDWRSCRRLFRVAIRAQVKSGKRKLKQYFMLRLHEIPNTVTIVLTALNRIDCTDQQKEYDGLGLNMMPIFKPIHPVEIIEQIKEYLNAGMFVMIINDECDYGSGAKQLMSQIMNQFRSNPKVGWIGISASIEEIFFSKMILPEHKLEYIPSKNHCGAEWYLRNELVCEAKPFIEENILTSEGKDILKGLVRSKKDNFVTVRFASGFPECITNGLQKDGSNPAFLSYVQSEIPGITGVVVVKDTNPFNWGNRGDWKKYVGPGEKILIIICQTATRSTEVHKGFLKLLYAWHDYRSEKDDGIKTATFGTMYQAFMRVTFFSDGKKDSDIRPLLYCHIDTIRLAAKQIGYDDWKGKLHSRLTKCGAKVVSLYKAVVICDGRQSKGEKGEKTVRDVHKNAENIYRLILTGEGMRSTDGLWFLSHEKPIHSEHMMDYETLKMAKPELFGKTLQMQKIGNKVTKKIPEPTKSSMYHLN